jgi:hypothetical protein
MGPGARTPEELETLFEDAFVVRDRDALAELFDDGAVLVADGSSFEARGGEAIARSAATLWGADQTYLAEPSRVVQSRDTVLVVGPSGVNVVRRGCDGAWRYTISVLSLVEPTTREQR